MGKKKLEPKPTNPKELFYWYLKNDSECSPELLQKDFKERLKLAGDKDYILIHAERKKIFGEIYLTEEGGIGNMVIGNEMIDCVGRGYKDAQLHSDSFLNKELDNWAVYSFAKGWGLFHYEYWFNEEYPKTLKEDEPENDIQLADFKLKCNASPAIIGHIFNELVAKGYIEPPLYNAEINLTALAKWFKSNFEIETTEEYLRKVFNPNSNTLSFEKKQKFTIPELKDLE
jgi:hypothetical protein